MNINVEFTLLLVRMKSGSVVNGLRMLGYNINRKTVYRAKRELAEGYSPGEGRCRRPGGGARSTENTPAYNEAFDKAVEGRISGSPTDPSVSWVSLTETEVADKMSDILDKPVSEYRVKKLLRDRGFRKRRFYKKVTLKYVEGRDEQLANVKRLIDHCLDEGKPVISIDTKKKEMLGNFARTGQVYCTAAPAANDHDFGTFSQGTIVPHGILDIGTNRASLTLGISHDTSLFVTRNIEAFWKEYLQYVYPDAENPSSCATVAAPMVAASTS